MGKKIYPEIKIGTKIGSRTVVGAEIKESRYRFVPAVCDCGRQDNVRVDRLYRKPTLRCLNCSAQERIPLHGVCYHPLYNILRSAINRCHNPLNKQYHQYGLRGIRVHSEWRADPRAFIEYIETHLGPRTAGHHLDRVDNNGNYEPGNVRWVTQTQNNNNRKNSRVNRIPGEKYVIVPLSMVKDEYFNKNSEE